MDPFCGCGTTVVAAQRLGRRWAGIGISSFTCHLVPDERLKPLGVEAHIEGVPADVESTQTLCDASPRAFETWALQGIPGIAPNERTGGDRGIGGRGLTHDRNLVLAQVAGGRSFSMAKLRDFIHVVEREKAAIGVYVTLRNNVSAVGRVEAAHLGRTRVGAERAIRGGYSGPLKSGSSVARGEARTCRRCGTRIRARRSGRGNWLCRCVSGRPRMR